MVTFGRQTPELKSFFSEAGKYVVTLSANPMPGAYVAKTTLPLSQTMLDYGISDTHGHQVTPLLTFCLEGISAVFGYVPETFYFKIENKRKNKKQ